MVQAIFVQTAARVLERVQHARVREQFVRAQVQNAFKEPNARAMVPHALMMVRSVVALDPNAETMPIVPV